MGDQDYTKVLDELITVFSNQNDSEFKGMEQAAEVAEKLVFLRNEREKCIKDELQSMLQTHQEVVEKVQLANKETLVAELAGQKRKLSDIENDQTQLEEDVKKQKHTIQEYHSEKEQLMLEKESLEDRTDRVLPSIRHDINLYNYISGVRWQKDCEPHEVRGYASNTSRVKTFSLDTRKNSQFFITNYIWDLMETDW